MPAYNSQQFDPPAPVAEVVLRNRQTDQTCHGVLMLLDTGADISLVPGWAIEQLQLSVIPDIQYELVSFDGERHTAPAVELEMVFHEKTLRGRFLAARQFWGILGRNVLNQFSLHLNGPGNVWDFTP